VDIRAPREFTSAVDAAAINRAALLLAPVVRSTPLERCERLSVATGAPVLLKREDTQVVRSYKVRGTDNLIESLAEDARAKGRCARAPATTRKASRSLARRSASPAASSCVLHTAR
jgi:threonine dehydratase